jgi:osmotically-inducible protein OsmY
MLRVSYSRWAILTAIAATACFSGSEAAFAQSLFGGTGGGATSQTGGQTGGSSFGGSTGSNRTATSGSSGFSSQFGGTNQFGGGTNSISNALQTGGAANAQTGVANPQFNTQMGELSATVGQGAFVGRSDTAGTFVGNRLAGQQSIQATDVSGVGQFGGSQFSGRGQGGFGQGQGGFGQGGFGTQSQRTVRHSLRIAFDHPDVESTAIQTKLNTQFQQFRTSRPELQDVQIQIGSNQEVVLRGRVQSEDDKKLAAMLARLEPGVRTVKNELAVESN